MFKRPGNMQLLSGHTWLHIVYDKFRKWINCAGDIRISKLVSFFLKVTEERKTSGQNGAIKKDVDKDANKMKGGKKVTKPRTNKPDSPKRAS